MKKLLLSHSLNMEAVNVDYTGRPDGIDNRVIVLATCKERSLSRSGILSGSNPSAITASFFCATRETLVVAKVLHWFQEQTALGSL